MAGFILRRLAQALLFAVGAVVLVFFMVRLTGDPSALMLAREATPEQRAAFRTATGLDRPLFEQLARYLGGVARGDLGRSLRLGEDNLSLIWRRLPATLELALAALFLAVVVGVPLGLLGGMAPGSSLDTFARAVGLAGQTVPNFWLAMLLILVFAVNLGLFPSFGRSGLHSLVLPALALGFALIGQVVRLTRASVLEVRSEDYVRTARAKGMRCQRVSFKHVIPNAAIPLISVLGVQFTYLLGGSVYIEVIFAWPGLGSLLEGAIRDGDFPLVQAITIFFALFAIMAQLLSDALYAAIDPRVRMG
jgi:ABC-type dipeptide/oligopeptide/nickel transport system permease component